MIESWIELYVLNPKEISMGVLFQIEVTSTIGDSCYLLQVI